MVEAQQSLLSDEQRIAALRALATKTDDALLAIRFRQIADALETRRITPVRH